MKKKLPGVAIALIVLLTIRAIGQILAGFYIGGPSAIIYLVLAVVYIAALVGTVKRQKWAPILVIVVAVVDAVAALAIASGDAAAAFGAILMDGILIALALYDKKYIDGKMKIKE